MARFLRLGAASVGAVALTVSVAIVTPAGSADIPTATPGWVANITSHAAVAAQSDPEAAKPELAGLGHKFELFDGRWRVRHSVLNHHPVDHSIAIEKNCASRYFMLSHFVSKALRVG